MERLAQKSLPRSCVAPKGLMLLALNYLSTVQRNFRAVYPICITCTREVYRQQRAVLAPSKSLLNLTSAMCPIATLTLISSARMLLQLFAGGRPYSLCWAFESAQALGNTATAAPESIHWKCITVCLATPRRRCHLLSTQAHQAPDSSVKLVPSTPSRENQAPRAEARSTRVTL